MENKKNSTNIILSQWQTCVEMANAVSDRRDSMNKLFVTANLAMAATVSIAGDAKTIALLIVGIMECIVWMFFIRNYKHLNSVKFDVISNLENQLPTGPFTQEWEIVRETKKYIKNTTLEYAIPAFFIILYVVLIVLFLFYYIS